MELIIEPKDFPVYLRGRFTGDASEIAKQLGVTKALVYLLLQGKRKPSPTILRKAGLEIVYRPVPVDKSKGSK